MSVKINCLNPIAKCGMELLPDTYEVTDNFADADAVLVRSASMHDLELSDNLLAVARAGAGVNNIPLDKCAEKGIVVFNTPGANANGVKELVVAAWGLSKDVKHITNVEDIYRDCDYITVHVPALDSTKGMINADAFALMKDGVKILNFARDVLVNDEDMKAALDSGKVAKYMTDFPNPAIAGYKNVVAFPHLGASTAESEDNCAVMACKEIKAYINDGNIKNSVNYPNVNMGQCSDVARVTICHKNIPNMLTQFTGVFSKKGGNVSGMISKAKGDYAYSILDIGVEPTADDIAELSAIEGVVKVRVIK